MTRSNPLVPSFNAGELSPRLHARADFSKYPAGLETCENLIPLAEGGLMRRSGSRYVAELKSSSVQGRLRRFQFSDIQAYIIEMAEQAFRFYRHQGQITVADTDGAITNGTFAAGISSWIDQSTGGAGNQISHDATNGRLTLETSGIAADDIGWAEQAVTIDAAFTAVEHLLKFRVIGAPSDRIELRIGTTSTGSEVIADRLCEVGYYCVPFTPGATTFYVQFRNRGIFRDKDVQIDDVSLGDDAAVELQTPYVETDLFTLVGAQSADVLYLFHPSYPTHKLERRGHADWALVEIAWQDGPWGANNEGLTDTTLTPSATSGLGVTVTASSTEGINSGDGFQSTDIRRLVRIDNPASDIDWGWGIIVAVTSTTVCTVDVRRAFGATTADERWRLGSWSETTGYPAAAAFYQQRLAAANTTDRPQTFWASNTADFENMSPDSANATGKWDGTVEDDDALDYTISADDVNAIRWISPGKETLVIGTVGGEWVVSSSGSVITPSDVVVDPATSHGTANIQPLRVGNVVLFIQRALRKIREFAFEFTVDGFQAIDMTRLAEHVTRGGTVEMAYAEEPNALVWAVRGDGVLLSMTFRREEDVVGWARHIIGGSFGAGNAVVESAAVIPGADGAGQVQSSESRDEVWIIVKRTINAVTTRYIEVLEADWDGQYTQEDAYYSDSLITYDGAATATITGLDHLEGETVKVMTDGAIHPDRTVASGSITLDDTYSVVQVGLGYTHKSKLLKMIAGAAAGTPIGKTKQIFEIVFVLLNSHTLGFGPDESNIKRIDFREVADLMDTAVPAFTGEYRTEWDDDWQSDPRIVIQSDDPAPFTLLAVAPEVDTREV
jgi:hypothetical protein